MKLRFYAGRWHVEFFPLSCGQQVQMLCTDAKGKPFYCWARFEIDGVNNPVIYTTFGRVSPDLATAEFRVNA